MSILGKVDKEIADRIKESNKTVKSILDNIPSSAAAAKEVKDFTNWVKG